MAWAADYHTGESGAVKCKGKQQNAVISTGPNDKAEVPGHYSWGHRWVSGTQNGLPDYEPCVEVGGEGDHRSFGLGDQGGGFGMN